MGSNDDNVDRNMSMSQLSKSLKSLREAICHLSGTRQRWKTRMISPIWAILMNQQVKY